MKMRRIKHISVMPLLIALMAFTGVCFVMLSFAGEAFDLTALVFGLVICLLILLEYFMLMWIAPHADRNLFILTAFLVVLGIAVQYRMSAQSALHQLFMILAGAVAMLAVAGVVKRPNALRRLSIPFAVLSIAVLVALLFVGRESGGAKNWISIGGNLFQPSEFVKVALIIVLADALSEKLRMKELVPAMLFTGAVIILLVLQKDLGAALLVAAVFLLMYFSSTGNAGMTLAFTCAGGLGAYASYYLFDHVRQRVAVWLDPWATYSTSGYQIAQGLMAIASGGLWGEGLGMGSPSMIPAYRTDYVFAVICEEFGIVFGIGVIAVYALIVIRGIMTALSAEGRFEMLCAFGASALIAVQTFIIIGGVIKLIPLTGITLPFVSYGGSSMIASMLLLGIIEGISNNNGKRLEAALEEAETEEDE